MGRPKTPLALLKARDSFKKHPERLAARMKEPVRNGPIGRPPRSFSPEQRKIWRELVSEAGSGVLAKSDRLHLEMTVYLVCRLRVNWDRLTELFHKVGATLITGGVPEDVVKALMSEWEKGLSSSAQEATLLVSCLAKMGMTPKDRARIIGTSSVAEDPFDDIAQALGAKRNIQ